MNFTGCSEDLLMAKLNHLPSLISSKIDTDNQQRKIKEDNILMMKEQQSKYISTLLESLVIMEELVEKHLIEFQSEQYITKGTYCLWYLHFYQFKYIIMIIMILISLIHDLHLTKANHSKYSVMLSYWRSNAFIWIYFAKPTQKTQSRPWWRSPVSWWLVLNRLKVNFRVPKLAWIATNQLGANSII